MAWSNDKLTTIVLLSGSRRNDDVNNFIGKGVNPGNVLIFRGKEYIRVWIYRMQREILI